MGPENVREPLVTGERPEHLGERQIRQPDITEIDTVPGQHGHARGGGPARDLVQHPGLADSGVPGDPGPQARKVFAQSAGTRPAGPGDG